MKATGWCETCGGVEVEVMCITDSGRPIELKEGDWIVYPSCCHYADCPRCGGDVDQWATS